MSNLKPGMLSGIKYKEMVELTAPNGEKYEVEIRPLRHTDAGEIQAILTSATSFPPGVAKTEDNMVIDYEKLVEATYKANLKASAMGTVDFEWTENSINEEWPSDWITQVGTRVMAISGIGNPKEIERFRKERAGK